MAKKIAITGTIGSGKTTFSIILRRRHFPVFDADHYSRIFYHKGSETYQEMIDTFSDVILDDFGEIDRKKVASIVFSDEEKRLQLNSIIHPRVKQGLLSFFENHKEDDLVFAEIPLLYEGGWEELFDEVIVVTCSDEVAVERLMEYREFSKEDAKARIAAQVNKNEQIEKADIVIYNDGSIKDLDRKASRMVAEMRKGKRWN